jgi:hypothetical protein
MKFASSGRGQWAVTGKSGQIAEVTMSRTHCDITPTNGHTVTPEERTAIEGFIQEVAQSGRSVTGAKPRKSNQMKKQNITKVLKRISSDLNTASFFFEERGLSTLSGPLDKAEDCVRAVWGSLDSLKEAPERLPHIPLVQLVPLFLSEVE